MKYSKTSQTTGTWIKGSDLAGITNAKIVSPAESQPSQFMNKDGTTKNQDVCKIRFEGKEGLFNISLNKATINGLIAAFGGESANWVNKVVAVETEKVRVAGVARIAIYLIPEGYEKVDNEEGFAIIQKIGKEQQIDQPDEIPIIEDEPDSSF